MLLKVVVGSAPLITVLVAAAFLVPADFPLLQRQVLLCAFAVTGIAAAERMLFGPDLVRITLAMGFRTARSEAVRAAIVCSLPMWLFLPVYGLVTDTAIVPNADWLAILVGVVLVNGIAEEVTHRAFVFGHLRAVQSFTKAAAISAFIFGLHHFYLLVTIGPVAGSASVVLAILLVWPLAVLFERGGNSIVPPAIMHTGSNAPMMIFASVDNAGDVILPHMAVVLVSMYLACTLVSSGETRVAPRLRSRGPNRAR